MQNSILILLTLISAALSQGCNGLPEVCAANNCPAAPSVQVNSFTYAPLDFNLISFGSLTINNGDVEGRAAIKNNFNAPLKGISIGYSLPSVTNPSFSLIAGGNVNIINGEIYPAGANIFVGGAFTGMSTLAAKANSTCQSAGCLNSQFDTLSQYYVAVSAALAGATANVDTSVVYQQLVLTCRGSASIYTVQVAASVLNGITSYSTSGCDASSTFLFNIMGDGKVIFAGRAFSSHLAVFNVPMATLVEVDTFVYGDIIAPYATLNQTAGTIAGQVVALDIPALIQVNIPLCPNQTTTTADSMTSTGSLTASATSTGSATSTSTGAVSTGDVSTAQASSTTTTGVPSGSSTTTTGVPPATSTGSTTGSSGSPICTFLDTQAACPSIANTLNGNYTFVFGNYDVVVFGDLTSTSGDIEGRTFASGNVNLPNGQFSFGLRSSSANNDYTLVAGGLNFVSGSISRGRAFVAGASSVADYLQKYVDGPCTNGSCLDAIRSAGQTCYQAVSDAFASRSNAAITLNGNQVSVTCDSNTDAVYYINTDSVAATSAAWGDATNCNSAAVYVFNIGGTGDFTFSGAAFPNNNAVYNVRGSRTISIGASVHGNILAPNANVVMNSGLIVGKVVAASATIVQVNIPNECVNVDGNTGANSGLNSGTTAGVNAGINVTPSILVMMIALFFSRLF